jgi:transposase
MSENLNVIIERVDDVPLLLASLERMGVAELVDAHFPAHGNWQGLSPGKVLTGWLSHILSEADHRLNQVQDWAGKRLNSLRSGLSGSVRELDFSDDRLAIGLDLLSADENWARFERALNQRVLRVYTLPSRCVRIDSTTASGYWQVTAEGLFQFGHSKDHRPDLPQVKVVVASLDPLGMPLATQVLSGEKADDPLYIPAIDEVRAGVGQRGLLYVGDCKLMAVATRAHLQAGQDYYLGPFSAVQMPPATLDEYLIPVWTDTQPLTAVERRGRDGAMQRIAEGFERCTTVQAVVAGQEVSWVERQLIVRSLAQVASGTAALQRRLEQATAAIRALNVRKRGKVRYTDRAGLQVAVEALLQQYAVAGLLTVQYHEQVQERRVRKYRERPAETRQERQISVSTQPDAEAIAATIRRLGWRVYGTNCPVEELTLEQAVLAYRAEYLVERNFGRLKGKPLSLTPMYLEDDTRATGLIRLLSIGLRVLTLLEHSTRERLSERGEKLRGMYAGNPTRATERPTAEVILRCFKDIFLTFVTVGEQTYQHLTPLSELQQKLLALLDFPPEIYTRLTVHSANPP